MPRELYKKAQGNLEAETVHSELFRITFGLTSLTLCIRLFLF